jgi:uncharacterized protein GlcG (DUF336 family)
VQRLCFAAWAILLATPAAAQPISLDAAAAQKIVTGCAAHAMVKRQSHAIAVVDVGGRLIAALRMDGNGWGIMDFSIAKAEAVAAWGFPTTQMGESAQSTPGFGAAPHVVTVAGGMPVYSTDGKTRIGAVGVSGEAPVDDAQCAAAGISAAGLRSSRG